MAINENSSGVPTVPGDRSKAARFALHPLHEAAMRLADIGLSRKPRSNSKTKDLVSMLLSHGARAWRSSQPPARIHLHVTSHTGRSPVYIRIAED